MWKRIVWDLIVLLLVFIAPWWVTLIVTGIGAVFFPWYLEMIIVGALYDALFGGIHGVWYYHLLHTFFFTIPLLIIEFIKTKLNL